jgi:hypothetical protein
MPQKQHDQVANDIFGHLHNVNLHATVDELASELDVPASQVIYVLDAYGVDEHGHVKELGPGKGGGWISPDQLPEILN